MTFGPKIMDGLRAFADVAARRFDDDKPAGYWFADAVLVRQGYSEKVAASIIDQLAARDMIDWGITKRTGWLNERGEAALAGVPYVEESDWLDEVTARVG
jgi:hypothetical protein